MVILYYVWILIQFLIGYNLILPLILLISCQFILLFKVQNASKQLISEADYAIIITAYEQTQFIPSVVNSVLNLNYSNYLIYVVADNCDIRNLNFADERVILLRPQEIGRAHV